MRSTLVAIAAALALLLPLSPTPAGAQCADWLAGPLDNGSAANGASDQVRAVISWDPPDNRPEMLVVAGSFTSIGGVAANHIALLDPATGQWQPLGDGLDDTVNCLAIYNGELVAGGFFTHAGGADAHYVARYDGGTWRPLDNGINAEGLNGVVNALTVYNGALVLGGAFTAQSDGVHINQRVASWTDDATGFQPLGVGVACNGLSCNGSVTCFAQYGGALIAGGDFTYAGNNPAPYLARWDGASWSALPGGSLNGRVTCMQAAYGVLYIGGDFTQVQSPTTNVNYIVSWNGSAYATVGGGVGWTVYGMGYYNGSLIVSGGFSTAGATPANEIAAWNGSAWSALGSGLNNGALAGAIYPWAGELVVGGTFTQAGGLPASYLAHWNGSSWSSFGGGTASYVFALAGYYGRMVGGGSFNQSLLGSTSALNLAGWNGSNLAAYGTGVNGSVYALKSFKYSGLTGDYELVAGGLFTVAGGVTATRIARYDIDPIAAFPPPAWTAMGSGLNSAVYAIERFNNVTYAGGQFTFSGITPVSYVAQYNASSNVWQAVGTGMNGAVRALRVYNGYLYAGGDFTTAGGVSTGGLARWNGSSWSACGGFFNGQVFSLEVYNGVLAIGGLYPGINSSPNLAWYNGTSYGTFGTGGTNARVHALAANGSRLYVGGEFTTAGGLTARHIGYWDGSSWHEPDNGTDDMVLALGVYGGEVHAGGYFLNAGAVPTARWARFTETGVPAFAQQPSSRSSGPGQTVSFSAAAASGYTGLTYQWFHGTTALADGPSGTGSTIGGANAATLVISNLNGYDTGSYHVEISNACGTASSLTVTLSISGVGVDDGPAPAATVFDALGPNPAHGAATLAFALARDGDVRVDVLDVLGRRVREVPLGRMAAGRHTATWDARDEAGLAARAGLYFVRLEVDGRAIGMKRLAVVR